MNNNPPVNNNAIANELNRYLRSRLSNLGYESNLSNWYTRPTPLSAATRVWEGAKEACERSDAYQAIRYSYGKLLHEQLNISTEDIETIAKIMHLLNKMPKERRKITVEWLLNVAEFNSTRDDKEEKPDEPDFEI